MLFSKKAKGIYVDLNDHTMTVARTSGAPGALLVEELKSCPAGNAEAVSAMLDEFQQKRTGTGNYLPATCGVYPPKRVVRRATLDPKKYSEPNYFDESAASQCRITPDEYLLAVVSAGSGRDAHPPAEPEKDVIFCGMAKAEISATQKHLLRLGVFPERLELGTLSSIGAIVDYLTFVKSSTPTLVLEMGDTTTESFVVSDAGLATSRQIPQGVETMVPLVQKELGLKDEESARRLFYSNTFDFTGMASALTKKLIKELQSSIGFYEVQTGQSIGQVVCTLLPSKLAWMQAAIAGQLGVDSLKIDYINWLKGRGISLAASLPGENDNTALGVLSLMVAPSHAAAK
ncbi:MAG TPA: hypothetical protein VFT72_03270 [Opitutaceae bacterium]|nr:hypothetical protein [Opitutaceae bacterium]